MTPDVLRSRAMWTGWSPLRGWLSVLWDAVCLAALAARIGVRWMWEAVIR